MVNPVVTILAAQSANHPINTHGNKWLTIFVIVSNLFIAALYILGAWTLREPRVKVATETEKSEARKAAHFAYILARNVKEKV